MKFTRTHTCYFGEEQIGPLVALLDELEADWQHRRPHISHEVAHAGDARLALARHALGLLAEPVAESMT